MCWIVFKTCSNVFEHCSNVCKWFLMCSNVFRLWLWVVFGWLRLVLGGQKWLLAVMSGYQVFVFVSCLEIAILTTIPPDKMSLPDKTSILTKRPSWQNVHPGKMSILIKHTFVTKRLLTFSQHKSRALIHGRNSAIQIIHASGTPMCLVNIISVYFRKKMDSNQIKYNYRYSSKQCKGVHVQSLEEYTSYSFHIPNWYKSN